MKVHQEFGLHGEPIRRPGHDEGGDLARVLGERIRREKGEYEDGRNRPERGQQEILEVELVAKALRPREHFVEEVGEPRGGQGHPHARVDDKHHGVDGAPPCHEGELLLVLEHVGAATRGVLVGARSDRALALRVQHSTRARESERGALKEVVKELRVHVKSKEDGVEERYRVEEGLVIILLAEVDHKEEAKDDAALPACKAHELCVHCACGGHEEPVDVRGPEGGDVKHALAEAVKVIDTLVLEAQAVHVRRGEVLVHLGQEQHEEEEHHCIPLHLHAI
mmetsp:Transcript_20622/g.55649  ORF Transcript_20622/g.55649 Transcript_20622/m.55649 type:complete len:280 (+) Transcript_20622:1717-2556(+)